MPHKIVSFAFYEVKFTSKIYDFVLGITYLQFALLSYNIDTELVYEPPNKNMIKFYSLSPNLKYSFNQLDLPDDYDSENENSIYKLRENNYHLFKLDIKTLEVQPKIKKTDFLNAVFASPLKIVSEKTKTILEDFKLPPHKYYPFNVRYEGETYQYYFLFIDFEIWDYVNFKKSIFFARNEYNEEHSIELNSKKEYLRFLKEKLVSTRSNFVFEVDKDGIPTVESNKKYYEFRRHTYYSLQYKSLSLYKDISTKFDLFKITDLYVSEKLRAKLKENLITGITIKEARKIIISEEELKKCFSIKSLFKKRFLD